MNDQFTGIPNDKATNEQITCDKTNEKTNNETNEKTADKEMTKPVMKRIKTLI